MGGQIKPEHNARAAGLETSQLCGSPCSSHQGQPRSPTGRHKTLCEHYNPTRQIPTVAFANQTPVAWEIHPALLSQRSTEKLRQEGISAVSAPSSCSSFIAGRLCRALSASVFNITKDGHPSTSESICPYSRVASLSLGKCFPYSQLEFPLLQFMFSISCLFRSKSENNLDPLSPKYH